MQTRIQGTTMPVLDVQLDPNESVFSESGELSWMTSSIQMTTHTQMGGGGGFFGALKRLWYLRWLPNLPPRILIPASFRSSQCLNPNGSALTFGQLQRTPPKPP